MAEISVPWSSWGLVFFIILPIAFCIVRVFYNRFLHPLRGIPGPFWGSVTSFYNTYLFATRRSHVEMVTLHDTYGPFVRIAPNLISFDDPVLLPQIYHLHANKTPFYSTGIAGEVPPLLQTVDDEEHAKKLKVLSSTYSMQRVRIQEEAISALLLTTMEAFRTKHGSTKDEMDLAAWARWYAYDTLTTLIYSKDVGMVKENRDVYGLIEEWHRIFPLGGLVATLPWLVHPIITNRVLTKYLMPRKGHSRGTGHIMSVHEKLFHQRMLEPGAERLEDMFKNLQRTKNLDGTTLSLEDAERECFLLTVGGQDTSPAFICAFVDYILRTPGIYSKLSEEIRDHEQHNKLSNPVVKFEETSKLPYFMACVQETLRLSPSASLLLPRYAPKGGISLGGYWVPEHTEIAANPYVIHRNKHVFGEDAKDFRPERWLEDPSRARQMNKYQFAFGYGSRKCLGKNIAMFTSQKFCLQLFRDFDLQYTYRQQPFRLENWGLNVYFEQYITLKPRR